MADETPTSGEAKQRSDAAAISARIVALQGDSDEYSYAEPPPAPPAPVASPKQRRKSVIFSLLGAVIIFIIGAAAGTRLEKRRMHPPVAIINGDVITADEFAHASEILAGRSVLQRLIDDKLVVQFAKKQNVLPDQKAVEARYNELSRAPDFFLNLKRSNQSTDDFRQALYLTMCRQAIVSNGVKVNPSEVQDYYLRNTDRNGKVHRYFHPETIQVQAVISATTDGAEAALKEIQSGMQFSTAVMKYSSDVSKANVGLLKPIVKGGVNKAYPGLEKILFDMHTGEVSGVTKVGNTFWIIKCLAHNPEITDPFEKVQDECLSGLLVERGLKNNGVEIKKQEQEFVKSSNISITNDYPQYADLSPKR